jgi:hypothetical protein
MKHSFISFRIQARNAKKNLVLGEVWIAKVATWERERNSTKTIKYECGFNFNYAGMSRKIGACNVGAINLSFKKEQRREREPKML